MACSGAFTIIGGIELVCSTMGASFDASSSTLLLGEPEDHSCSGMFATVGCMRFACRSWGARLEPSVFAILLGEYVGNIYCWLGH
mmetsp:Transcript_5730/g.16954  ORF Transcript_5730/g.16954 Transcript_5730/m.16954 type:complete len:85 (+) Transcript_5730:97-351(+)